jgi:hypothetical protein
MLRFGTNLYICLTCHRDSWPQTPRRPIREYPPSPPPPASRVRYPSLTPLPRKLSDNEEDQCIRSFSPFTVRRRIRRRWRKAPGRGRVRGRENEAKTDVGHKTRGPSCPPEPRNVLSSIDGNTCPAEVAVRDVAPGRARRSSTLRRPTRMESTSLGGTCRLMAYSQANQASRLSSPCKWYTEWPRGGEEGQRVLDVAHRRWRIPRFDGALLREYEYLELPVCQSMALAPPERGRGRRTLPGERAEFFSACLVEKRCLRFGPDLCPGLDELEWHQNIQPGRNRSDLTRAAEKRLVRWDGGRKTGDQVGQGGFDAHLANLAGLVSEYVEDGADAEVHLEDKTKSMIECGDDRLSYAC